MKIEIKVPQAGESITEATVARWHKKAGDRVKRNEVILDLSTDKVDSEVHSPEDGTLEKVLASEGETVKVGQVIAVLETEASVAAHPQETKSEEEPQEQERIAKVSPLVATMAAKYRMSKEELETIPGTGEAGKITKQDFLSYIDAKEEKERKDKAGPKVPERKKTEPTPPTQPRQPPRSPTQAKEGTQIIPMDIMRQAIAEHMVRSKHTSPHVYSIQEIDFSQVSKWRQKHKSAFEKAEGFKLSITPFVLEAVSKALVEFPLMNSSVEENSIIVKKHINLGCAVALGTAEKGFGLIVPVIRNAEEKSLVGLARSLHDLADRARTKQLLPDEVTGGTFTITNPGTFGTLIGTPIINQPQVAILCMGAITKRPVVVDDMIAIREMAYFTLSYDHRVIDGSLSGMFLAAVRKHLENWCQERELC